MSKVGWSKSSIAFFISDALNADNTLITSDAALSCKKRWKDTQCIKCFEWSPHVDWYKIPLSIEELIKEKEEVSGK